VQMRFLTLPARLSSGQSTVEVSTVPEHLCDACDPSIRYAIVIVRFAASLKRYSSGTLCSSYGSCGRRRVISTTSVHAREFCGYWSGHCQREEREYELSSTFSVLIKHVPSPAPMSHHANNHITPPTTCASCQAVIRTQKIL
jgi:hypothetical protein